MNSVPHEVFELFHKYGKMMASQGYPLGEEARMLLDRYDGVYGTKKGADFSNLKWKDVVKQSDQHFATHKSGMHARVVSQTPYCNISGGSGRHGTDYRPEGSHCQYDPGK